MRRLKALVNWQTLLAALVALVASVIPALITPDAGASSPGTFPETATHTPADPKISIASWTETSSARSATTYVFTGTVTNLPDIAEIHVVIKSPTSATSTSAGAAGEQWLVSPPAEVLQDNRWKVTWTVHQRPLSGQWVAVVTGGNPAAMCEPLNECIRAMLQEDGPNAKGVYSTATIGSRPDGQ
ncbi:hypothetical protein [Streptomyces sp. S.PB5]|uniref:hypothetical protein n=1 Tax=Streptomyces sp. S.PB5 TaxID=3020844 RepID=UPI0025B17DB6|nr:hypothetical protein [Streptomyces sp. S.PB5]MDN3028255.1 hypothetical protein [Streptomyces sp. S.PB5]